MATTQTLPAISCDRALSIAQADAIAAYRDLSDFVIRLSLESDGWHIEYELKPQGFRTGGGPHYVIDAATGEIVSKKYYQ
jgi:hypothetical protein